MSKAELARDAAGLSGCGLVVAGVGMIYEPAALILGGLMLIVFAVLLAARAA